MLYEVEKRSLLSDEKEFNKYKDFLDKNAKFIGKRALKSFLFRKPSYLRIRLVKGSDKAIITYKLGEYTDLARKETETEILLEQLPRFLKEKSALGFNECACVHTERYSYEFNGLRVELNEIEFLGLIVEIEALTSDESEIPDLEKKIIKVMKILGIKELDPKTYQKMLDDLYSKTLKSVSEYSFESEK